MGVSVVIICLLSYIGVTTKGKSRMRQIRTSGSVRGVTTRAIPTATSLGVNEGGLNAEL